MGCGLNAACRARMGLRAERIVPRAGGLRAERIVPRMGGAVGEKVRLCPGAAFFAEAWHLGVHLRPCVRGL